MINFLRKINWIFWNCELLLFLIISRARFERKSILSEPISVTRLPKFNREFLCFLNLEQKHKRSHQVLSVSHLSRDPTVKKTSSEKEIINYKEESLKERWKIISDSYHHRLSVIEEKKYFHYYIDNMFLIQILVMLFQNRHQNWWLKKILPKIYRMNFHDLIVIMRFRWELSKWNCLISL